MQLYGADNLSEIDTSFAEGFDGQSLNVLDTTQCKDINDLNKCMDHTNEPTGRGKTVENDTELTFLSLSPPENSSNGVRRWPFARVIMGIEGIVTMEANPPSESVRQRRDQSALCLLL
ncbi:hypothetical protein DPMN_114902 [Dreissena polymorpha]|uniref:Uncharacterized protein n=1 Tax=Dreissena polymorpha TaxID=45954 RepID=A0A9D4QS65_DREPO|nr:hypothetical protein DPMN_114902 [Dreissena polymorpha]